MEGTDLEGSREDLEADSSGESCCGSDKHGDEKLQWSVEELTAKGAAAAPGETTAGDTEVQVL